MLNDDSSFESFNFSKVLSPTFTWASFSIMNFPLLSIVIFPLFGFKEIMPLSVLLGGMSSEIYLKSLSIIPLPYLISDPSSNVDENDPSEYSSFFNFSGRFSNPIDVFPSVIIFPSLNFN